MRDGVFFAATQLFGLTFEPRNDIPVYHPDVRVFEVCDADRSSLALLYLDHFKRDNKTGGAWMDAYVDQSRLLGTKARHRQRHELHEAGARQAGAHRLR